jgi:hypothetical protein
MKQIPTPKAKLSLQKKVSQEIAIQTPENLIPLSRLTKKSSEFLEDEGFTKMPMSQSPTVIKETPIQNTKPEAGRNLFGSLQLTKLASNTAAQGTEEEKKLESPLLFSAPKNIEPNKENTIKVTVQEPLFAKKADDQEIKEESKNDSIAAQHSPERKNEEKKEQSSNLQENAPPMSLFGNMASSASIFAAPIKISVQPANMQISAEDHTKNDNTQQKIEEKPKSEVKSLFGEPKLPQVMKNPSETVPKTQPEKPSLFAGSSLFPTLPATTLQSSTDSAKPASIFGGSLFNNANAPTIASLANNDAKSQPQQTSSLFSNSILGGTLFGNTNITANKPELSRSSFASPPKSEAQPIINPAQVQSAMPNPFLSHQNTAPSLFGGNGSSLTSLFGNPNQQAQSAGIITL